MENLIDRLESAAPEQQAELLRETVDAAFRRGWLTNPTCERALRFIEAGASLDAALALKEEVLPGSEYIVSGCDKTGFSADIGPPDRHVPDNRGSAPTPAAALCIAILKAKGERDDG